MKDKTSDTAEFIIHFAKVICSQKIKLSKHCNKIKCIHFSKHHFASYTEIKLF